MTFFTNGSYISSDVILVGNTSYNTTTTPTYVTKIAASDGVNTDRFGLCIGVGCGLIVVGNDQDDDLGTDSGSAYIFNLSGTQLVKLTAFDGAAGDRFGYRVDVNNNRIVVTANFDNPNGDYSGSAYLYDLTGNLIKKITPSDGAAGDNFGASVSIGCGRIVIGADFDDDNGTNSGSAYIFDLDGNQLAKIKAYDGSTNDNFGTSLAVGNGRIVVGAAYDDDDGLDSGSAYIFDLNGNLIAKIRPSDGAANRNFGSGVAVGFGRIVVGALLGNYPNNGTAYIFDLNGTQLAKISASDASGADYFGASGSISISDGRIFVGAPYKNTYSGAVYVYNLSGTELTKLTNPDLSSYDYFGLRISSAKGVMAATSQGENGIGAAYIWTTPRQDHLLEILD